MSDDGFFAASVEGAIKKRGPDSFSVSYLRYKDVYDITLSSAVLYLRGDSMAVQPVETTRGTLLWNGEIFGGIPVDIHLSDTLVLSSLIYSIEQHEKEDDKGNVNHTFSLDSMPTSEKEYTESSTDPVPSFGDLLMDRIFSRLHGPFAFIYYRKRDDTIWFGRDRFGRRSLLWNSTAKTIWQTL